MERHMQDESRKSFRAHIDAALYVIDEQRAREQERQAYFAALKAAPREESGQAEETPSEALQPQPTPRQRREVPAQPQAYPDEGWRERPRDFTPLRNAGIGLTLLLTAGLVGMQIALNRLNSDSPSSDKPKPVPTATLTPGQLRSVDIYNQLVQAAKNGDARLARSVTIDSDININVRNRSSAVTGEIEGQFKPGQHITVDNIEVLGDDPNTPEVETNADTWVAFRCTDIRDELTNIALSSSVPPKEQDICFAYGQYVQRNK